MTKRFGCPEPWKSKSLNQHTSYAYAALEQYRVQSELPKR